MRKWTAALLSAVLCLSALAGCQPRTMPATVQPGEFTIIDMLGRERRFSAPPTRIVALLASDVEILYAIGAEDLIVGVGEYCNYPARVSEKDVVSSGAETNLEQIIALNPDVVIMGAMAQEDTQIQQLEDAGIPVVNTNAADIGDVYTTISLLGQLTDRTDRAEALVDEMVDGFTQVAQRAGDGTKSIYFEVSPLEYGLWTAGSGTFMQELCDLLKINNVFSDKDGWTEISETQVLQRNPDYIATVTMYYGDGPASDEEILSRPGWDRITAVQEGRIYCADNDMLTRPGPRLVEAAQLLADFVYGPESQG